MRVGRRLVAVSAGAIAFLAALYPTPYFVAALAYERTVKLKPQSLRELDEMLPLSPRAPIDCATVAWRSARPTSEGFKCERIKVLGIEPIEAVSDKGGMLVALVPAFE